MTSQLQSHGIEQVLVWLEELGLSNDEILETCNRRWRIAKASCEGR